MLRGRCETTVDNKGRVGLPDSFRDFLVPPDADQVMITTAMAQCIAVFPCNGWNEFEKKLFHDPKVDNSIKRFYISGVMECPVDGNNRILIPPVLREYAGIEKEVVWLGMLRFAELWDAACWEQALADTKAKYEQDGSLAMLGL